MREREREGEREGGGRKGKGEGGRKGGGKSGGERERSVGRREKKRDEQTSLNLASFSNFPFHLKWCRSYVLTPSGAELQ